MTVPTGGGLLHEDTSGDRSRARRLIGVLLVILSAICFGSLPILARVAYGAGADPSGVLLIRFVLASAVLWAIMAVRRERAPRGAILRGLVLLGGAGYVGQSLAYYTALTLASVSLVALLLYLYPVLVTVMAALLLRERLHVRQIAALALALAGAALTIGRVGSGHTLGILLALLSALIYSGYILVGSRLTAHVAMLPAAATVTSAAAAVFCALAVVHRPAFPTTPAGWSAAAGLALLGSVVGIMSFFGGMRRVGPSIAATLSTLEPVVAVGLAVVLLKDTLGPGQIAGAALIGVALIILARHTAGTPSPDRV